MTLRWHRMSAEQRRKVRNKRRTVTITLDGRVVKPSMTKTFAEFS